MNGFAVSKNRILKARKIESVLSDYLDIEITNLDILDIGSGNGVVNSYFATKKNRVTCVDIEDQRTDKKEKVSIMLDKIEHAVKTVIANKDRINGVNVGKAFAKPISAAAITDFLKKRSDLINEILDNDPTRFPESRAHFRPLQNIIPESKLIERTG